MRTDRPNEGRGSARPSRMVREGRNRKAKDFLFPRQQKLRQKDGKMDGLRRLCRISEEWLHAMRWNVSLKAYIHNFIFPVFLRITEPGKSSLSWGSSPFPDCAEEVRSCRIE